MCNEKEFTQAGFDAIAEAMHQLYPDQEGLYYGTVIPYFLGGSDPLDGVEVWKSQKGIPHWHYVTYGFTELYEKESDLIVRAGRKSRLYVLYKSCAWFCIAASIRCGSMPI